MPEPVSTPPLADDLLNGAEEIGAYIGESDSRKVFYALERKHLPAFKVGRLWKARKSEIDRAFSASSAA